VKVKFTLFNLRVRSVVASTLRLINLLGNRLPVALDRRSGKTLFAEGGNLHASCHFCGTPH